MTSGPTLNQQAADRYPQHDSDRPPTSPPGSDTMVWVALSGGGTRAAALAWAVLHEFRKVRFSVQTPDGATESNLADQIDHLSGISGGSFAAAAWALFGDRPDRRELFEQRFLRRNIQRALVKQLVSPPWNIARLARADYGRSQLAADFYQREVFEGRTFSDLPPSPGLHIHATHLARGERFTFSDRAFAQLGSNLGRYPIGYACAASSAFPVLLSPITLANLGRSLPLAELEDRQPRYRRAVLDARAQIEQDLRRQSYEYFNDKVSNKFVHLADGGLVDNQGLQATLDEFESGGLLNSRLNDDRIPLRRLVVVNVNAGTGRNDRSGSRLKPPTWRSVMMTTMVASMDVLSAKRWMRIQSHCRDLYRPLVDSGADLAYRGMDRPYTIEVNFRNLSDADLRSRCQALPTSFHLDADQLQLISLAARKLVAEDPHVRRLAQAESEDGPSDGSD